MKHHADVRTYFQELPFGHVVDALIVHEDSPGVRPEESQHQFQQNRLARSACTQQKTQTSGLDLKTDVPKDDVIVKREQEELRRRERLYRGERPLPDLRGKIVILVDDGLATGSTMRSAVAAIKQQSPAHVIVAAPVAARSTCEELEHVADKVVCAVTPFPFYAVGQWYDDFGETSDQEVHQLLARAAHELQPAA